MAGDDTMLCVADEGVGGARLAGRLRDLAGLPEPARLRASVSERTLWHGRFDGGRRRSCWPTRPASRSTAGSGRRTSEGRRRTSAGSAAPGSSPTTTRRVLDALDQVAAELAEGGFAFVPTDEDIHTAVERRVTELAGPAGARLTRAAAATTRWPPTSACGARRAASRRRPGHRSFQQVLLDRAREAGDTYLPGYTHLQRAQPVLLAHHLLAHGGAGP